jgi:hypothetical protein
MKRPGGVGGVPSSPGLRGSAAQGWRAPRKVAAGSTPERQLLVCWLSLEGTLTVTWNKFGLSLVSLSPPLSLRRTHSRAPHRECLRRSLFSSIRDSDDARSSIRIVSHRVSSRIGIELMETSASRIEDGVCTSSSLPHTTESDTAAAALQGSPSDVAAVEQQPCARCKTNSGKNGKHTCEKRRRTGSGPLAPSQRPRRGSAPVVHEDDPSNPWLTLVNFCCGHRSFGWGVWMP